MTVVTLAVLTMGHFGGPATGLARYCAFVAITMISAVVYPCDSESCDHQDRFGYLGLEIRA